MSGLCGILRRDGASPDGGLLGRMLARVAGPAGAAGAERWSGGEAALGVLGSTLPTDPGSGLVLLLDGRIGDRAGILARLRQDGPAPRGKGDAALLLAALLHRGERVLDTLRGDFAFALWDPRRRLLLAARDGMGLRPFYYAASGEEFAFASTPLALREVPAFRRGPDEGVMGEVLAEQEVHPRATLWEGISRLPPGHLLLRSGETTVVRRWWRPEVTGRSGGRSDGEWTEEFRALLRDAVGETLEPGGGVGILLSGGVDSGAVGAFAAAAAGAGRLRGWTVTFPGFPFDEGPAARVSAGEALEWRPVPWEPPESPPGFPPPDPWGFPSGDPLGANFTRTCAVAAAAGDRVLLTGDGGDEWLGRRKEDLLLCLRELRWLEGARRLRWLSGGSPRGALSLLARQILLPLLPGLLGPALARREADPGRFPWFEEDFLRRLDLPSRIVAARGEVLPGLGGARGVAARTGLGWWQTACEGMRRNALAGGVELRHPLLDRRIVEFALRTPPALRWDGRESKRILRRSAAPLLPAEAAEREVKPHATDLSATGSGAGALPPSFPLLEGRGILRHGAFPAESAPGTRVGNARFLAESLEGWLASL